MLNTLTPEQNAKLLLLAHLRVQGGKGSGNFGHGGRPGQVGGSGNGDDAAKASPVDLDKVKQIHEMHAQGMGNAAIAKRMGWHYSEGKRVQRVLDTTHPDGRQKEHTDAPRPVEPPRPVERPEPVKPVEATPPPSGETIHETKLREAAAVRAQLAQDRCQVRLPYSMNPNTKIGQENIAAVHTSLHQMVTARQALKDMGVKPPAVRMMYIREQENIYARAGGNRVSVNVNNKAWKSPEDAARMMRSDYMMGFHPTSDAHAVLVHEMGHNLHSRSAPDVFNSATYASHNSSWAHSVSRYAATNHKEFVAETFTGLVAGKSYSQGVMAEYNKLGGPKVPRNRSLEAHRGDTGVRVLPALQQREQDDRHLQGVSAGDSEGHSLGKEPTPQPGERGWWSRLRAEARVRGSVQGLGGKGSGNFHHEGRPGEKGGSGSGGDSKVRNERSLRALKAFIPVTKEGQRHAERMEHHVARMVGGRVIEGTVDPRTGKLHRNAPVDVVTTHGGKKQGIEVKTLLNQTNDKLTVRKNAAEKKTFWGRSNHASVHIVAVDARPGKSNQIYYRKGHGSFRLHSMTKVKNGSHLRKLLGA